MSSCPKIFSQIVVITIFFYYFISPVIAVPTTQIEQQILLTNQLYYTSSTTADPTDNSLGLFNYDSTLYNFEQVYFEAVLYCSTCSGGNASAQALLYDSAGNTVTGGSLSTDSDAYIRVRTTDIAANLTDNTKYTIRLKLDATSGTAYLKSAKLIVTQNDTAITDTLTTIPLGSQFQTSNSNYTLVDNPKIFYFDTARHTQIASIKLAASLKSSTVDGTAYASLSTSNTCASSISGSEVSLTGEAWDLATSDDIKANLSDDSNYYLCLKSSSGQTASLSSAFLLLYQSDTDGIDVVTLMYPFSNVLETTTDSSYTLLDYDTQFNPSHLVADRKKAYFEAVLKTEASTTAYVELYNTTDSINIENSTLTTTNTSYTRLTSNELFSKLPSSFKNLDVQIKNSDSSQTALASSWLLIEVKETPLASLTFSLAGIPQNSVYNGITTSVSTDFNTLPFGNLTATIPKYAAHQLTATTNAVSGYTVNVKMLTYLQGNYPANNIDPFIAPWSSPTTWTEPSGTTPNDNTAWFGANTTDVRVNGWADGSQKFGAINNTANTVMLATGEDTGTTAYVTYALEANIYQGADLYSGSLIYSILPIY